MEFISAFLIVLIVLDIMALRWGFDSRDGIDRLERKRHLIF